MRRHLTYANVISSICLFIVLGGSAYAATTITGKQVRNNSLTGADIRNGTLQAPDFKRGLLSQHTSGSGTTGGQGPQGPAGAQGAPGPQGPKGDAGPGAVPISLAVEVGEFQPHYFDVGAWKIAFTCTDREGRPQIQLWGQTDEGAAGTLEWVGIRSHSSEGSFVTTSGTEIDTELRGLDSRWAPAGGWAAEGLDIQYRSGGRTGTVSLHMMADDRPSVGRCTVAGTGIGAGS